MSRLPPKLRQARERGRIVERELASVTYSYAGTASESWIDGHEWANWNEISRRVKNSRTTKSWLHAQMLWWGRWPASDRMVESKADMIATLDRMVMSGGLLGIWPEEVWADLEAEWKEKFGSEERDKSSDPADQVSSYRAPIRKRRGEETEDTTSDSDSVSGFVSDSEHEAKRKRKRLSAVNYGGPYRTKAHFFLFGLTGRSGGVCEICVEDEVSSDYGTSDSGRDHSIVQLSACGHRFGKSCLFNWTKGSTSCPSCGEKLFKKTSSPQAVATDSDTKDNE